MRTLFCFYAWLLLISVPARCKGARETYDFIFGFSAGYQGNAILSKGSTYSLSSSNMIQFMHEGKFSEMKSVDLTTLEWENIGYEEEYTFVRDIFVPHIINIKGTKNTLVDLGNHINYFYRALTSYLMTETSYTFAFVHILRERNEAAVSLAHRALQVVQQPRTKIMNNKNKQKPEEVGDTATAHVQSEWNALNAKGDLCEHLAYRFCPYNRKSEVIVQICSDRLTNSKFGTNNSTNTSISTSSSGTVSASDVIKKIWVEEFTLYQQAFWMIDEVEERYHMFRAEFPNVTTIDIVWAKQWPQSPDLILCKLMQFMGFDETSLLESCSSSSSSSSKSSSIATALNAIDHNILHKKMTSAEYMLLLYEVAIEDTQYRDVIKCVAKATGAGGGIGVGGIGGGGGGGGEEKEEDGKCYKSVYKPQNKEMTMTTKYTTTNNARSETNQKQSPDFVFCLSTGHVGTTVLSYADTYNLTKNTKTVRFMHELWHGPLRPIESIKTSEWEHSTYNSLYSYVKNILMPYYVASKQNSATLVDLGHHIIYFYQPLVDYLMKETNYSFAFVHIFRQPQEAAMSLSSTGQEKIPSIKLAGQLCPKLVWRICPQGAKKTEIRLPIPGGIDVWHTFTSYQMAMWMVDEINERFYDLKYNMEQQQQQHGGWREAEGGSTVPKFQTMDIIWGKTWPTSLLRSARQVAVLAGLPRDETSIILENQKSHAGDRSENFELLYTMALLETEYRNIMGQSVLCLSTKRTAYQRERYVDE